MEESAAIDMQHGAFAGKEAVGLTEAGGSEAIGGLVGFAAGAVTGDDETGVDDGADEGDAFVGELLAALMRMESEMEIFEKVMLNDVDVADELILFRVGDDDIKVVDVATVMFIAEIHSNKTVELVEEDIGDELAGEIADDDAVAGLAIKETFVRRKGGPILLRAADGDAGHRVIINNLMPEEFHGMVEALAVARGTEDVILLEIIGRKFVDGSVEAELTVETPANAFE